jgi:hypothetical protein
LTRGALDIVVHLALSEDEIFTQSKVNIYTGWAIKNISDFEITISPEPVEIFC